MYGVGTIQGNKLQGAPLNKKYSLQKEARKTSDYTSNENNFLKCWSKAEKKHVDVPMPDLFKEHNANMEGC